MDSQGKAKVALTFALYQGDQLVRRDTIAQDIVKVGKDPRSHLRVDDDLASRMHAVIEVASPADITLIDLGNEPGTLVNGQRVNKCKVRPGDQIQIGSTLIVLENAEPATASPPQVEAPAAAYAAPAAQAFAAPAAAPAANPFAGANPFASAPAAAANPFAGSNPFSAPAAPAAAAPFAAPSTPFVAQASAPSVAIGVGLGIEPPLDGGPGGFAYSMLKSGPDVNPDEVEIAHVSTVEVMILWESNVLHVSHLTPPRSFYVGEEFSEKSGCDYFIPSETLGTTRAPIVVSRGIGAAMVILPRSRGYVDVPGQGKISLADLVSSGRARPSSEMSGGYEYELPPNAKARMELEGSALVFQVSATNAGKKVPVGFLATMEPAAFLFTGLSFLLHMGLVAVFAFFMPSMRGDDSEDLDRDQILMMQKLLNAAADREQEERQEETQEVSADQKEGGTGTRAKGEEGSMGNPNTKDSGHKYGVQGPKDNPDPHLAKMAALQEAAQFGMIGLISTMGGGDPNAPT
ncbi:MAG TPA: FHA domain-containing protein, partial [Thermoanaerobaculia bacterium]|nr:FHA domain-containing protein [Thermoanaerobaculia bacterium]